MKKKNLIILSMVIAFILFSCLNAISGIEDEKIQQSGNTDKPELDISNNTETNVVETSTDDISLNSSKPRYDSSATLTPIQTATSVASGLIASGTTDESVVKATLISYGYEETEADIAYVKASTNNVLTSAVTAKIDTTETTTETNTETSTNTIDTETVDTTPTVSAKDRVAQTTKVSPKIKFRNRLNQGKFKVTDEQKDTVNQMLDEGYSIEQIAQGFNDNKYSSSKTALIFKESGVSSIDSYEAISTIAVKEAEANAEKNENKPRAKFFKRFGSKVEEQKMKDKQNAIKTTVNELKAAGYDVQETLDVAVQDLKDNGMSAKDVKNFLISKVANGKPKGKFGRSAFFKLGFKRTSNMESYGQGEISLATAMIKSGYTESEVTATFESGTYKYTSGDTHMIVSAAARISSGEASADLRPTSSTNVNTSTQTDILKRNTQALPI